MWEGGRLFSDPPSPILYFLIGPPPHYTIMHLTPLLTYFLWFSPLFLIQKYHVRPPSPVHIFFSDPPYALHNYRLNPPSLLTFFKKSSPYILLNAIALIHWVDFFSSKRCPRTQTVLPKFYRKTQILSSHRLLLHGTSIGSD